MANNVTIKDGANADKTVKTTDNTGVHTPHHNIDSLPAVALDAATLAALETINAVVSGSVTVGAALPAGTNNIGDVDIATMPAVALDAATLAALETINAVVSGSVNLGAALPAGTNNIGDVDVLTLPALPTGTNNIGDVDIASITAGEAHIGKVTTVDDVIALTPVLDTVAYAAGDVFFVPTEITGFARTNGGIVTIVSVAANSKADVGMPFDLLFLDSNTSIGTINAAVNLSSGNANVVRARVSSGAWLDLGGAQHSTFFISPVKIKVAAGQTSIWVAAIARSAGTFAASDLILHIGVEKS